MTDKKAKSVRSSSPLRAYRGRTLAFRRYRENSLRTHKLLTFGLTGLAAETAKFETLARKFDQYASLPGPIPKGHEPTVELVARNPDGSVTLEIDPRSATIARKALRSVNVRQRAMRFHLYGILTVAAWGSFETYMTMVLQELFTLRPELLSSNELIAIERVVKNRDDVMSLLIGDQLTRVGNMGLTDLLKYLTDRLNVRITVANTKKLRDYYFVRNVVAHSSGLVRPDQLASVPPTLIVKNGELRVTRTFLRAMLAGVDTVVVAIEKYLVGKFYKDAEVSTSAT